MRLKSLFFPIMMVLSLAVFAGYIWPEIQSIRKINEEILTKKTEMAAINEKKIAIESVGRKISDNTDEDIVLKYLPQNKTEEQIIGGVNYLAGAANVSLIDISLNSVEDKAATADAAVVLPSLVGIDSSLLPQQVVNGDALKTTPVKIVLVGDYAKIRIFLDSLQRMPVINTVKSVNITKQDTAINNVLVAASQASLNIGDTLLATVEVDFGYLATAKVNNMQVEKFKNVIDNEVVSTLQSYVSMKSQLASDDNTNGGAKGKKNPFLAN
jgi:hypothetical protein